MRTANRIGALEKLTLSKLDLDNNMFTGIREKEGYITEVVFGDSAKELISEWLEMRKDEYDKLEVDSLLTQTSHIKNVIRTLKNQYFSL